MKDFETFLRVATSDLLTASSISRSPSRKVGGYHKKDAKEETMLNAKMK